LILATDGETTVFDYNVTDNSSYGVFTHFWITGSPASGSGLDNATVRYYIDGEATASIAFKPPLATGVGFDDLTLWGTEKASHGAKKGGWSINYRIPFQKHARVTVQKHAGITHPQICYVILRGAENMPIHVGDLELPGASARLALHKIEDVVFQPLAWVSIIDIPTGDGLIYQTTLAVRT
jgi:hypothetical protein